MDESDNQHDGEMGEGVPGRPTDGSSPGAGPGSASGPDSVPASVPASSDAAGRVPDTGSGPALDSVKEAALGALFNGAEPPAELHDRLRRDAEARFGQPVAARRPRLLRRAAPVIGLAAAAAAAVIAMVIHSSRSNDLVRNQQVASAQDQSQDPSASTRARDTADSDVAAPDTADPVAEDIDASGRVDIFDAYLLACAVEAGRTSGLPDIDGDGAITRADADRIAERAVEVPR